MHQTEVKFQK